MEVRIYWHYKIFRFRSWLRRVSEAMGTRRGGSCGGGGKVRKNRWYIALVCACVVEGRVFCWIKVFVPNSLTWKEVGMIFFCTLWHERVKIYLGLDVVLFLYNSKFLFPQGNNFISKNKNIIELALCMIISITVIELYALSFYFMQIKLNPLRTSKISIMFYSIIILWIYPLL